ncbi:T9SS type A sorting domain-containing protein [Schleiferiaceae bacterium]|nr:T9SS type A sorting domain-containing protein [Schleiferiaceae bacterium]
MCKLRLIVTLSVSLFFSFSNSLIAQSVTGEVSLVDRLGDDVLSYETGDSVYVLVEDADRNVSTSASDTLTVRLRSDKETTEEALVLTETGVNTGIFSGYMLFDETGSVSADGKLQVDRGDKLVARYRDPSDDFGNVANETSTSFYGLTVVNGGSLLGNTTWNTAGSPYLLTGDITVPNTVTLTIESGVEVRFTPLTDDLSSGEDVNRIELIIEGVLRVKGAQSDTVTFMSNGQVPASGDWYGIVSTGSTGKVLMDYASINHYTNGVLIKGGTYNNTHNNSDTISVLNTKFYGGGSAINGSSTGSYRPIIFGDNILYECGVYDYSYSSYKYYSGNRIVSKVDTRSFTVSRVRDGSNTVGKLYVNDNEFDKGQIYVYNPRASYSSDQYGTDVEIKNNILSRGSRGIEIGYAYNNISTTSLRVNISNNTIIGDKDNLYNHTGVYMESSGNYGLKAVIESNTFKSIGRGIYFSSDKSSNAVIKSNTIDSTYYQGIYLNKVSGRVESNTITKCGRYDYFGIDITSDFNYPAIDTLQYNTITGNGYWQNPNSTSSSGGWGGIRLNGYTQAKINYNNIYDNGAYEVVNNVAASSVTEQDAKFNYWGTYNNTQIALGANPKNLFKIYDKYDNSSLGFVNYGQNQSNKLFDELPDTVYYGGDSVRIASSSNKYGDWSTGETNANHVDLTGYEGELIFTYTLGSDILKDTVEVINLDAIYVSNSGSNQNDGRSSNRFKTIQKAIDEADAGDTIYIASGNYSYFRILEDQLYVYGEDSLNRPVITGHDTTRVAIVSTENTVLKNISFRNGYANGTLDNFRGGLLYSFQPLLTVINCDFKDGKGSQGGDYLGGNGNVDFIRCEFLENTKHLGSVGRDNSICFSNNLRFYNCFFDSEGSEKIFQRGSSYEMYNSTVVNLTQRFAMQSWEYQTLRVVNCILVEKPGYQPELFPRDTTYFWGGWNGDNIFVNSRLPYSLSSITHWNGAQLISTNNDTLPVMFRDSANGDYRLSIYDRHLDKGTDTIALYTDVYGVTRVDSGGFVDYGAYETNGRGIIDVYACPGDDIGIDPFGITAPVWNNGDQGSTDVGLGKYWASGTINGNAYVDTFMVIDAGIDIQSSDTIVCPGTEVTLTAVGWQGKVDPIFTWGDGTVNVSTSATVSENTTFYLYSDFDGISCTDSFTVYVNRPAISSSSDFACAADSTLLIVESQKYLNNQISATSTLNDSMLLWMPFDGTIKDEGPGSNSFTNTGVVLANGRNGSSGNIARLDGDSYLEFDSPIATGQKQMTFAFWAQTNSNSAQDIIGQNCGTDCGTDVRVQLNPAQCSGDGLGFKSPAHFAAASQTHDSSWHHYALVMGSGDNFSYSNFKFYIDGVEVSNSCGHNWGGWTYTMPNEPLRIGKGASLGTNFNGLLDDIGVWKRALTSSEVQELASMGEDLEAVTQVLWSTGETNDSIWVKQSGTSQYWVQTQFGDAVCSDSVKVFTAEIASSDTIVCPSTAVTLNAIGINGLRDVPASYIKLGQLGDKQYFLDTTVQSWTDANASALSNGFSLVDIQDSTENAAVGSMVSGSGLVQNSGVWIGVYQDVNASNYSEPSGGWTHVNSNSNYYPWALGEPNNAFSNPGENYAELYIFNGQPVWADLQNSFTRFAVVEVPTYMYEPIYWSTGDTGISTVVTPLQTSTYYIYSENAGLTCTNELTIYVNDPDISASTSYACDGDSVLLSVGSQSFYAPAIPGSSTSILWSTGQTTDSIWINQTQTSSYWVQTTLGDAVCWDTITINSAELTVTDQFICEGESITASIAGWDSTASSFVYWSSMDTSTSMTTILDTTTQFKVYTTVNGESCIDSINVYVNDPGIDVSTRFLCESGTLSFAVEDETTYGLDSLQSKTFVWSTGDTVSAFNLIQDSTTQYVVTSTWSSSVCYDSVIVNNKHFTNPSDAICYGGPQTISVDGWADGEAVIVNWSTGDTSTSIVVSPLVDTTYYVTTSYAGVSCTDTAHIYVNDARITASSMVVCVDDSVSLSVPELSTSGQTKSILWSTGDTTSTIWVSQDSTTSYWVSVGLSDAGCTDTIEILTTIPVPQISSSFTTYNLGTGLELTSTSATTYTWSDSTSGSSINVYPSITTDYWVKVTDTNACVGYDTITVKAAQITFRVNMRTQIVDSTKGVHLAGNFQGWDPDSTQMYDADGDGIYEVTLGLVSGDAGIEFKYINGNSWSDGHDDNLDSCTNVTTSGDRSYTVAFANDTLPVYHLSSCDENMPIDPLVDAQSFECVGDTTFLDAGPGLTDIIWNTGDTSRVLAATTPGWYWFLAKYPHQVRVYDSTYVNFYEYTDTSVVISGPTSFCDEDSVVLGLASDVTATWSNGSMLNDLVVMQTGNYYATLLDTNGCTKNTDTIAITVWQLPLDTIFTFGGTEICDGDSVTISATYGYDYAWNNGDTNYYTVIKQAGDYAVTITDGNGCVSESDTISIVVNILPNDSLTLSGLPEFCDRDSLTISAQSGYNYQWSDGSLGQALTVYQSGQVHVQLTDNKGCISESDTIDVIVNPLPDTSITVIGSLDLCPGDTVTLSAASGMGDYFWSTGSNFQAIDITQSGLYRVTLVSSDGCVDTSAHFQSVMHPLPVVSSIIGLTTGVTPMQNYVYLVSQNSGSTYTWSITNGVIVSGQGTNVVTVMWSQASNGILSVIESNGYCEDSTELAISTTFSVSETAINPAILFPNPTKGMFKIVMNYAEPVKVHLVDSRGKELSTFIKNSKEIELDASEYPAGVYQVILEFENEVQVLRLVVIH